MSVTIKRNLILATLSTTFFLVASHGFTSLVSDRYGFAPFIALLGSFGFILSTTALLVRLWGNEKE